MCLELEIRGGAVEKSIFRTILQDHGSILTALKVDIQAQIKSSKMFGMEQAIWPIYYASTPLVVFSGPPLSLPVANTGLGAWEDSTRPMNMLPYN